MPGANPPQESGYPDNSPSVETEAAESTKSPTTEAGAPESLTSEGFAHSETPDNTEQHINPSEPLSPDHAATSNMPQPPPYQFPPNQFQTIPMQGVEYQYAGMDHQGSGQYPESHPTQNQTFGPSPANPYQHPASFQAPGLYSNRLEPHSQPNEQPRPSLGASIITTVSGYLGGGQQATQQVETSRAKGGADYAALVSLNKELSKRLKDYKAQYKEDSERLETYEKKINLMAEALKAAEEKNTKLERRLSELRSQIYAMVTGSGPVKEDSYYQGEFNGLSCLIEKEMRKFSRTHNDCVLADDVPDSVFELVGTLGDPGKLCCEMLQSSQYHFQLLYKQRSLRVVLLRHIVALYLFHHIFEPFAFGLSDKISQAFKLVDKDAIKNESQFSNTMMIHQATGRTANKICAQITESKEVFVTEELAKALRLLLPLSPTLTLATAVQKFVTTAVKLKQIMTAEYGLYYPEWILPGTNFEEDFMEAKDEVDKGLVVMCVFPGLIRKAEMEQKIRTFTIVKSRVMLQSAFDIAQEEQRTEPEATVPPEVHTQTADHQGSVTQEEHPDTK